MPATTGRAPSPGSLPRPRRRPAAARARAFRLEPVRALEDRALLAAFLVNTVADSGPGSLRQAILDANTAADPAGSTIDFALTGTGPFVIRPNSALPTVGASISIDGYSQPGAHANTLQQGDDAKILIRLDGADAPGADGLTLSGGGRVQGLSITQFVDGIHLTGEANGGTSQIQIWGNFLGTDPTGAAAGLGNADGVRVDPGFATYVALGNSALANRNLISGNASFGAIFGGVPLANFVQNNYIGTTASGMAALPNGGGIFAGPTEYIGGYDLNEGNLISGNSYDGIVTGGGTIITGNVIGLDAAGSAALGNGNAGVDLAGGSNTTIGGYSRGQRNVIAGNLYGILQSGLSQSAAIIQNYIGTDVTGSFAIGNTADGAFLQGPSNSIDGNLISGNGAFGLVLGYAGLNPPPFQNDTVTGNIIGPDITGMHALSPAQIGIGVYGANNIIGGTAPEARNQVSGNAAGIQLFRSSIGPNVIQGNWIGTDSTGAGPLGNAGDGVTTTLAYFTTIGGYGPRTGNVIAFNGGNGVTIGADAPGGAGFTDPSFGNSILSNLIYANAKLGIDLGDDGVTPIPYGGTAGGGPNRFQPYPTLGSAVASPTGLDNPGSTTIAGTLSYGQSSAAYTIQLFSNPTPDPSGYGQGRTYLGQVTATSDAKGYLFFTYLVPQSLAGQYITATATDANGSTSEFSADLFVRRGVGTYLYAPSPDPSAFGQPVTVTAEVSAGLNDPSPVGFVRFLVDGDDALSSPPIPVTATGGGALASYTLPTLGAGGHVVNAVFSDPSGVFASSTAGFTRTFTVAPAATASTLTAGLGRSTYGEPVSFLDVVRNAAGLAPGGTVTFFVDGVAQPPVALVAGQGASSVGIILDRLAPGDHILTAVYNGDGNNQPSFGQPVTLSVGQAQTATTLVTSGNPAAAGGPVTFTATVAAPPGVPTPTDGTVTFRDGSTVLAVVPLGAGGQATFTTSTLAAGTHAVVAAYSGGVNDLGSTSAPVSVVVTAVSPQVVSLAQIVARNQPTRLALAFSGPLDPTRVQDLGNYLLFGPGAFGNSPTRQMAVASAVYDANAHTVTLTLGRGVVLRPRGEYRLSVNGTPIRGVTGVDGGYLEGAGRPGSTYVRTFRGADLPKIVAPAPIKPAAVKHVLPARRTR